MQTDQENDKISSTQADQGENLDGGVQTDPAEDKVGNVQTDPVKDKVSNIKADQAEEQERDAKHYQETMDGVTVTLSEVAYDYHAIYVAILVQNEKGFVKDTLIPDGLCYDAQVKLYRADGSTEEFHYESEGRFVRTIEGEFEQQLKTSETETIIVPDYGEVSQMIPDSVPYKGPWKFHLDFDGLEVSEQEVAVHDLNDEGFGSGFITKLEINKNDEDFSKCLIEYEITRRIIDKIQDIKIFIGSTRGSLNKVKYFAKCLPYMDPKFEEMKLFLWDKDVFDIGETSIESLIRTSKMVDMAVFFFTGEDILITENNYFHTIRDNLLFEYGLFMGTVGIKNVYILMEKNNNIKLPSDLYGVNYLTYNDIAKMDHILNAITKKAKDIFVEKVNTYLSNKFESQDHELKVAYHKHIKKCTWRSKKMMRK